VHFQVISIVGTDSIGSDPPDCYGWEFAGTLLSKRCRDGQPAIGIALWDLFWQAIP